MADTRAGRVEAILERFHEGKITAEQARELLDSPEELLDSPEIESAATDAEQRYQARERGLRAVAHADVRGPTEDAVADMARKIHATGATPSSLPVRRSFALAGTFRVYFNRHQAAPLVWCVLSERGNFEMAVAALEIDAPTRTVYRPKVTPDDEDGKPSAWLEVDGVLAVDIDNMTAVRISRAE